MRPKKRRDDDTSDISSATLERWSRMAEKLRSRLDETQRENERLHDLLDRQTAELEDLRDDKNYQQERIEDLEFQCVEKSARISSLAGILEHRKTTEMQEILLQKSLEHAEMSLSVDRLRLALNKCEQANQRLLEEKGTLQMVNEELSKKVEQSTMSWDQAKKEQQQNRKMLLEMGDVIRTLNCFTVDFDATKIGRGEQGSGSLENIKRKIQAMEDERQRLIQECNSLRQDNDSQRHRIQELENQSRSWSTTSRTTRTEEETRQEKAPPNVTYQPKAVDSRVDTQTSPFSMDTSVLGQDDFSTYIEDVRQSVLSVASDVSSFSELEAPPPNTSIRLEDHHQLKRYYEESLERIIRMSAELGKFKADAQEQQAAMESIKEKLDETLMERDEARREVEEALSLAETAASKQEGILQTHKKQMQALQHKYDQLDAEYSQQLEELEQQIEKTEEFFKSQCDRLKQEHAHAIDSLEKQQKDLKREHDDELQAEKDKSDDLNEELDVLMEIHTKLEDDLDDLQKKYDEALNTIVGLEDKVRSTTELGSVERAKLEKDVGEQSKLIAELKAKVDKSKEDMQEAVLQQQKLRRENEVVLAQQGQLLLELDKAKQKQIEQTAATKELRDNCCDMEERVQRAEHDSSTRFQQLQSSYQMAISKITSLANQLYQVGIPIYDASQEVNDGSTSEEEEKNLAAHEKIKRLEQELMGIDPIKYPSFHSGAEDAQKFTQDYALILKNFSRRTSISKDGLEQPFWYSRLTHQFKMVAVQRALMRKVNGLDELDPTISFDSLLPDFIIHEMKMRSVLAEALQMINSRHASSPETKIERESIRIPTSHLRETPAALVDPGFFEHQRLLTIVHYDIIARAEKLDSSRSSGTQWKNDNPQDIGEAQSALLQLKGETQKIKLAANTAKIRYEAREKEHRVLRIQYQKLLEQYNQAVKKREIEGIAEASTSDVSSPKVKTAVQKIQRDAALESLKVELRNAELKVERMVTELRNTKTKADHTRKQQEEGEKSLQYAIRHEHELNSPTTSKGVVPDIFRQRVIRALPLVHSTQGDGSFDGSRLTSVGGINCGEGCDERCEERSQKSGKIQLEGGIDGFLQLQNEHEEAKCTISMLRTQLLDAEHEAEHAKIQLKRREENLRDVIREYNQVKQQADALMKRNLDNVKKDLENSGDKKTSVANEGSEKLIRERNVALGKISLLEAEVTEARRIAKEAHRKRIVRETQLRDVIEQYKELNQEHKKTLSMVEELQGALASYEPGRAMEARQRSHESEEPGDDKRETSPREQSHAEPTIRLGNRTTSEQNGSQHSRQKNKANIKTWFRDLGHQKGAR